MTLLLLMRLGVLSKVAIIYLMDDNQTGTNDLRVAIQLPGGENLRACKSSMLEKKKLFSFGG